jgi:hypothetical protein
LQEENEPLEIRRSLLGLCFENAALQLDEVLAGISHPQQVCDQGSLKH